MFSLMCTGFTDNQLPLTYTASYPDTDGSGTYAPTIYKMLFFAVVTLFVSMSVYVAYVSTLCAAVMITADFQAGEMFMLGRGDPFLDFALPVDVVVADMHNAFVAITINVRVVGNLLPGKHTFAR